MINCVQRACVVLAAGAILVLPAAAGAHGGKDRDYRFAPIAFLGDPAPGGGQFTFDFEPSAVGDDGTLPFTADVTTGGEGVFVARNRHSSRLRAPYRRGVSCSITASSTISELLDCSALSHSTGASAGR